MRKTKNITVAVTERKYHQARIYAASREMSVSALVEFLLEHLPLVSKAVRNLIAENPNFGSNPARLPHERRNS